MTKTEWELERTCFRFLDFSVDGVVFLLAMDSVHVWVGSIIVFDFYQCIILLIASLCKLSYQKTENRKQKTKRWWRRRRWRRCRWRRWRRRRRRSAKGAKAKNIQCASINLNYRRNGAMRMGESMNGKEKNRERTRMRRPERRNDGRDRSCTWKWRTYCGIVPFDGINKI